MQELNACCPTVQQMSAAGSRYQKKRNAVRRSSDEESTSARPRSVAFALSVGDERDVAVTLTGWNAGGEGLVAEVGVWCEKG